MSKVDDYVKLLEFFRSLLEKLPKKRAAVFILLIVIGLAIYFVPQSEYYQERFYEVNWEIKEIDNSEQFISDYELKAGSIVVRPQVVVEYENLPVIYLNITGFYESDGVEIERKKIGDKEKDVFELKIAEGRKENLENLKDVFLEAVRLELGESYEESFSKLKIYDARVAEIYYQNKRGHKRKRRYLLKVPGEIRLITKEELGERVSDNYFSMIHYSESISGYTNSELNGSIKECVKQIRIAVNS